MPGLAERLEQVQVGIADAARAASRDPAGITTVVVTKFHPASLVRELYGLGIRDFGESRHQEAGPKASELADLDATWHFVGQLQSKKARQAREYISVLHSLDRQSLLDALTLDSLTLDSASATAADPRALDVFIQVNLTDDPQRGGVAPVELEATAERVAATSGLTLLGLMVVAPLGAAPQRAFATLRVLSDRVQATVPAASALSMGMSGDYREAILEGATHLRIGTAITGNRPLAG